MTVNSSWTSEQLAHQLCDLLVTRGELKEKPAFIRSDREAKIASIFSQVGLDGAKMGTFDNPGPLEMLVRKGSNGEVWVVQVIAALISMLPEEVATARKQMTMDQETKDELAAAQEKSSRQREIRDQEQGGGGGGGGGKGKGGGRDRDEERGGDRGDRGWGGGGGRGGGDRDDEGGGDRGWGGGGGDRGKGRGGGGYDRRERDDGDREPRGGRWSDSGDKGGGRRGGGGAEKMECFNCGQVGHSARDCTEPRKEKGKKGEGKRRDRGERQCLNCNGFGHISRDCPEPPDEEKVRERLAAKAARGA